MLAKGLSPTGRRPGVEVADIFRAHGEVYRQEHVLTPDQLWVPANSKYLFPVKVLSRLFRGIFLDGLQRAVQEGAVRLDDTDLKKLLDALYASEWVVYAKRPFGGPEQVFQYLGRYTHRVGLSNQRLISFDQRGVRFASKGGRAITLSPQEFIRRFLLHVLPSGFVKIRHYGLWASGNVATRLAIAKSLLPPAPIRPIPPEALPPRDDALDWQKRLLLLVGIDVTRCPLCQLGRMIPHPFHGPTPAAREEPRDTS